MLSLAASSTPVNLLDTRLEAPFLSTVLANGNTLNVYLSIDGTTVDANSSASVRAVQADASGARVPGSDFEIEPFGADDEDYFAPELVVPFSDGSFGIFASIGSDFDKIEYRRFSVDPVTQATTLTDTIIYDYEYSIEGVFLEFVEIYDARKNADGTTTVLAQFDGIALNQPDPFGQLRIVELDFSANGTPLNTANTAPVVSNGDYVEFLPLKNGDYVSLERFSFDRPFPFPDIPDVQVKFFRGDQFHDRDSAFPNLIGFSNLPTNPGSLRSAALTELPDGQIAMVLAMSTFANGNRVVRHFTTVADPDKEFQPSFLSPLVELGIVVGASEFPPAIVALDDGTYVVAWGERSIDTDLTPTRVFLQHMSADGVPLSGRIEAGSAGPEVGLSLTLLPSGQVQLATGAIDGMIADADVRVEIFDVTPTLPPPVVQVAQGNAEELFMDIFVNGTQTGVTASAITYVSATDPSITGQVYVEGLETDGTDLDFGIIGGTATGFEIFRDGQPVLSWNGLQLPLIAIGDAIEQNEAGDPSYLELLLESLAGDYIALSSSGPVEGGSALGNSTGSGFGDVLVGGRGNNVIDGLTGADTMHGEDSNDTYYVENSGDVVVELEGEGDDIVYTSTTYNVPLNVEVLIMQGTDDLNSTGTAERDIIQGNSGANIINGAGGFDVMAGGAGNDTYAVDNSSDAVIEAAGEGQDAVYTSVNYQIDEAQEIETAILTGNAVILRGSLSDNQLFGNDGVNVLEGNGGTDYLLGLGGDDIFQVSLEANATDLDVFGDFEGAGAAGGDRIAFDASIWGADGIVYQVSQTSFIVATAQNTNQQQFIIANLTAPTTDLIAGDDFYFG